MKNILTIPVVLVMLSSCSMRSYTEVSSNRVQETNHVVDKTDFAKIDTHQKQKIEGNRQDKYHSYANEVDKKLNHQKNDQLNKKKGWDSEFSFY